ncbi:MAG: hypothetical protein WC969_15230 [Elusimicrobiota bacterium]|jgi:hypothetical protein
MPIYAENSRFQRLEVYGAAVARPVAAGEVDLCQIVTAAGQYAFVSVLQAVQLNPTTTVLSRLVTGLSWRLYIADQGGKSPKPVAFGPGAAAQDQVWTFTDGTPAGRNILVAPNHTLIFRAFIDPATAPATITHVAGAIVGVMFHEQSLEEFALLSLVDKP